MGALPKQRVSQAHQGNRRRHHFITAPTLVPCKSCGAMKRAHHVCLECGMYRGRQVIQVEARQRPNDAQA